MWLTLHLNWLPIFYLWHPLLTICIYFIALHFIYDILYQLFVYILCCILSLTDSNNYLYIFCFAFYLWHTLWTICIYYVLHFIYYKLYNINYLYTFCVAFIYNILYIWNIYVHILSCIYLWHTLYRLSVYILCYVYIWHTLSTTCIFLYIFVLHFIHDILYQLFVYILLCWILFMTYYINYLYTIELHFI